MFNEEVASSKKSADEEEEESLAEKDDDKEPIEDSIKPSIADCMIPQPFLNTNPCSLLQLGGLHKTR